MFAAIFTQDCTGGCFDSAAGAAGRTSPVEDQEYGVQVRVLGSALAVDERKLVDENTCPVSAISGASLGEILSTFRM